MLVKRTGLPQLQNRKPSSIQVDEFKGGSNVLFSETRLEKNEAKDAQNLLLIEDGIWDKRWGTAHYGGVTWTNRPDGAAEYRKVNGDRELIVVADGKVWRVDPLAGTKTEITGATYTQGEKAYFIQYNQFLYIANGVDSLGRYNGTTLTSYSGISTPTWDGTPITRGAGLASGNFVYYYRVSAVNEVGETVASTEEQIAVDIDRDMWNEDDEYLDLAWADVSGAVKYHIYFADTSGYEVKLAESSVSQYRDDGTAVPNPYIEPNEDDTTSGPKFGPMWISGNRIWGTKDVNNPQRAYFSGTGVNKGNFADAYGGGWVDLELGGRATTTVGADFQGKSQIFCSTPEGRGTVWQVILESQTIDVDTFTVPIPTKIISSIGTGSPRSLVYMENDMTFFNPKAMHVFGNEPGVLNVLRTNELTAKIRPYIRALAEDSLEGVCAYYYDTKVFVSVPTTSGENDRIIVFDRERTAWIKDWSIGVSQFLEHTDNNGNTHFLGITSDRLVEFSENYSGDQGVAFAWKYTSPRFPVSKDWKKFARIFKAFVHLRGVTGSVNVSLIGTTKNLSAGNQASETFQISISASGMGWDRMGTVRMGTSGGVPTSFSESNPIRYLVINKLLRDVQITIEGSNINDRAAILGFIIEGRGAEIGGPLSWQLAS